jgi:hypothetical protein
MWIVGRPPEHQSSDKGGQYHQKLGGICRVALPPRSLSLGLLDILVNVLISLYNIVVVDQQDAGVQ